MLEELKGAVSRRRRRLTALRWSGVAVVPVLVVASWLTSGGPGKPESVADKAASPVASPSEPTRTTPVLLNIDFEVVETDAGILERYAVTSLPVSPETFLDDDSLLALLAAANRPTGLVRFGQQVFLTADVTGEPSHGIGEP